MAGSRRFALLATLLLAACGPGPGTIPTPAPTSAATAGATSTVTGAPSAPATNPPATNPPATPVATAGPGSGSGYEQLLALIPPQIAATCTSDESRAQMERALAVAFCEPQDVISDPDVTIDRLLYFSFDSDVRRLDMWSGMWEAMGEPPNGECSGGPSTDLFFAGDQPVGRIVCGPWPQTSFLAAWWYDDRVEVVMQLLVDGSHEELDNLVGVVTVQP